MTDALSLKSVELSKRDEGDKDEEEEEEDLPFPSPPVDESNGSEATPPTNSQSPYESSEERQPAADKDAPEGQRQPQLPPSEGLLGEENGQGADSASAAAAPSSTATTLSGQKFVLSGTGTEVYVTHSPSQRTPRLVILLTNSLGLGSENNLKIADEYAKKLNCPVIVPDLFDKDPIRVSGADIAELDEDRGVEGVADGPNESFFHKLTLSNVKAFAASTIKGFFDEMWLAKHTFERTYPRLTNTIAEIVQVYSPQSLAVIGYSFGGRYVLRLLEDQHHDEWSSEEDLIAVGACIHPSLVEETDFEVVKKPLMLVYSSDDPVLSDKVIQKGISSLQERDVRFDSKMFTEKLPHGFAVLGDYPESVVGTIPRQVIDLVSEWVQVHLE